MKCPPRNAVPGSGAREAREVEESKVERGGVVIYAAQAIPPLDEEIARSRPRDDRVTT